MRDISQMILLDQIENDPNISLEERIQFLMHQFHRLKFQSDFTHMRRCDSESMHPGKAPLLVYLIHRDKMTITDMAKSMNIKQSSLTIMVNRLYKDELVNKELDRDDSRKILISLSEKGRQIAQRHLDIQKNSINSFLSALNMKERETLYKLLKKILTTNILK